MNCLLCMFRLYVDFIMLVCCILPEKTVTFTVTWLKKIGLKKFLSWTCSQASIFTAISKHTILIFWNYLSKKFSYLLVWFFFTIFCCGQKCQSQLDNHKHDCFFLAFAVRSMAIMYHCMLMHVLLTYFCTKHPLSELFLSQAVHSNGVFLMSFLKRIVNTIPIWLQFD